VSLSIPRSEMALSSRDSWMVARARLTTVEWTQQMITGDATAQAEKPQDVSERTLKREAFFLDFATAIRAHLPQVPLMVTGGFRTRQGIEAALGNGDCDLIGLGRPACLNPLLPKNTIFDAEKSDDEARLWTRTVKQGWLMKWLGLGAVGAGAETVSSSSSCRRYYYALPDANPWTAMVREQVEGDRQGELVVELEV
jgi:hypothetical protein